MPTTQRPPSRPRLGKNAVPTQQRASDTVERILEAAAATLAEVGFERLSTNLVCERAGLTPPALYRYFPNKYAILIELGRRLMDAQDAFIPKWITLNALQGDSAALQPAIRGLIWDTYTVTRDTLAGIWIMRAVRAMPVLQEVRLASHTKVTHQQALLLHFALPHVAVDELVLVCRVVANLIHGAVEMMLDEPCDPEQVADMVAGMVRLNAGPRA
jgi:AcrR family transcriptional regulator